jgi:hypothetical protein
MRTSTGFTLPEPIGPNKPTKETSSVTRLDILEPEYPVKSTDVPNAPSQDNPSQKRQHFKGWRGGILIGIIATSLVLVVNVSATVLFTTIHKGEDRQRKILFKGSCNRVQQLNLAGHVLIAILNTVLLSASNYSMQCLTAPTRADVDRAHQGHPRSLVEVGVLSFSNLKIIRKGRVFMLAIMGLSSLVLQLL